MGGIFSNFRRIAKIKERKRKYQGSAADNKVLDQGGMQFIGVDEKKKI